MPAVPQTTYSEEEYLNLEEKAETFTIRSIEARLLLSHIYPGTDNVKEGWITPEE
ncbi:hypothetical protein [Dyadobacter luteus]|uniref:hypothetical protein n=1 Tax=Dyadobacter luteus TaxID=2259619 RepID=UPI0013145F35|nr:hypothetical protein [Dyadobacter luteus]